jgi:hypothetical protein
MVRRLAWKNEGEILNAGVRTPESFSSQAHRLHPSKSTETG